MEVPNRSNELRYSLDRPTLTKDSHRSKKDIRFILYTGSKGATIYLASFKLFHLSSLYIASPVYWKNEYWNKNLLYASIRKLVVNRRIIPGVRRKIKKTVWWRQCYNVQGFVTKKLLLTKRCGDKDRLAYLTTGRHADKASSNEQLQCRPMINFF